MKNALIPIVGLSCLLTVGAQVASAVDSSGRNSHFWVTLRPQAGTGSAIKTDLVLTNGYRSANLDSPHLSCTRVKDGSKWIYEITWSGNNFSAGVEAETLQFNVAVEAFSGATFFFRGANSASVASLGKPAPLSGANKNWAVGNGGSIGAGESIRMSLRDFRVNGVDLASKGLVLEESFSHFRAKELRGGAGHKMIFGVGKNLRSATFGTPTETCAVSGPSYSVTAAGGAVRGRDWAMQQVHCAIVVRNPALTIEDPEQPFSDLVNGHTFRPTPYPPTTPEKLKAFPSFSWDRVPRGILIRKSTRYSDDEFTAIAENYDLVVLEKANGAGQRSTMKGMLHTAARLKKITPDITILFYWNSRIFFGHYGIDDSISRHRDEWIDRKLTIRDGLPTYDRNNPDFLKWWVGCAEKMIAHPQIDGTFVDKSGVPIFMLDALYNATPANKLVMNNNAEARQRIGYVDGTYREGWSGGGSADKVAETIAIARETGLNKKMQLLRMPVKGVTSKRSMEDRIDRSLAIYLLFAEEYSYFYWQATVDARKGKMWEWEASYIDQLKRPLGKPLGPYTRDSNVYTRSFEHCDVFMVYQPGSGSGSVARILWKNNIGNPAPAGSGTSGTDDTYKLNGGGAITGKSDQFFFLSDAHYGDGSVRTSIDSLENTHADAKAGVMFRESLAADAKMVAVFRDPAGRMHMCHRPEKGAALISGDAVVAGRGNYAKLVRDGESFTGYCSTDGKDWTEIAHVSVPMREKIEMGMAVASHNQAAPAAARFSGFARVETSKGRRADVD